jgi:hypothetical protein
MRIVILASAAIPAAVWAVWPPMAQPIVAKPVMTEGVTARRSDSETFRARWSRVNDMPPMTVLRFTSADTKATINSTRQVVAPPTRIRRARPDLCQRHHMRKVHYGRSWRCRR